MNIQELARKAEKAGQWEEAEKLWNSINPNGIDAKACRMIIEANKLGDSFRNRVKNELVDEPDKHENAHAWVKWFDGMSKIHTEIYKPKN